MRALKTFEEFMEDVEKVPKPVMLLTDELYMKGVFFYIEDNIIETKSKEVYETSAKIEEIVRKSFPSMKVDGAEICKESAFWGKVRPAFSTLPEYFGLVYAVLAEETIVETQLMVRRERESGWGPPITGFRFEFHLPIGTYEQNTRKVVTEMWSLIDHFETNIKWDHTQLDYCPYIEYDTAPHRRICRGLSGWPDAISLYRDGQRIAYDLSAIEKIYLALPQKSINRRDYYVPGLFTGD
jgi:hypothetical protein